jgi:hypothetical protein
VVVVEAARGVVVGAVEDGVLVLEALVSLAAEVIGCEHEIGYALMRLIVNTRISKRLISTHKNKKKNWCVPFGKLRESKPKASVRINKDIEMNPKADDSHTSTNEA